MARLDDQAGRRRWNWLRTLLVVSLGLNLLLVGTVIGRQFSDGPGRDRGGRDGGTDRVLRSIGNVPFVMALDRQERGELAKALGGRRAPFAANREELRARFEQVLTVLRAESFDPEALRELMGGLREKLYARQRLGEDLLITRLSEMTIEERLSYAERLDRSLRRSPRKAPVP